MQTTPITINGRSMVMLDCDEHHILHRVGSGDYPTLRHTTVDPEQAGDYEEVAVADIPPYTEAQYKRKVAELIHQRYDHDDEIALANNLREADPTEEHLAEYAQYQAYRAQCKELAKNPELYTEINIE